MMNAKQDGGYSLICQSSEEINYLFVCSKFNVSTERVKRSCAADINMGSVVRLKNPDKIGTFCLLGKERERLFLCLFFSFTL